MKEITPREFILLLIFLFFKCLLEVSDFVSVGGTTIMTFPFSRTHLFSSQISFILSK